MANFICEFEGVRGRNLKLYDTKIVITTQKTVGSLITGNFTDGEKTIYLCDVVGIQFKKSAGLIGYLQFETPSMQMNNKNDNFFSENTFTYEDGKNGITNVLMEKVYSYVVDRIEELKYGETIITHIPDFESLKSVEVRNFTVKMDDVAVTRYDDAEYEENGMDDEGEYVDILCPNCGETVSLSSGDIDVVCPWCDATINFK